jgi:hypothetical protein
VGVEGISLCMKHGDNLKNQAWNMQSQGRFGNEGWVKTKLFNYICKKSKGKVFKCFENFEIAPLKNLNFAQIMKSHT